MTALNAWLRVMSVDGTIPRTLQEKMIAFQRKSLKVEREVAPEAAGAGSAHHDRSVSLREGSHDAGTSQIAVGLRPQSSQKSTASTSSHTCGAASSRRTGSDVAASQRRFLNSPDGCPADFPDADSNGWVVPGAGQPHCEFRLSSHSQPCGHRGPAIEVRRSLAPRTTLDSIRSRDNSDSR